MPSKKLHLQFDEYLRDRGVLCEETNTESVHGRMDRDVQVYGHWNHQYEDYYHDIKGVRSWIKKWSHLGSQDTKTDFVRVALGHLVLDDIWSRNDWEDEHDLMKRAYRSFVARGFERSYFKE